MCLIDRLNMNHEVVWWLCVFNLVIEASALCKLLLSNHV